MAPAVVETHSAYRLLRPETQTSPVIYASPHSGRRYTADFMKMTRLDARSIRRSEDAFIDEIFASAVDHGAPLIAAEFPRAFVDANREAFELDPEMFDGPLPRWVNTTSARVGAGLGTVARVVAGGADIYRSPLSFNDVQKRIERTHKPYHGALRALIDETVAGFGCCLVIDCHSMPSLATGNGTYPQADIVLGDSHGRSCNSEITYIVERTLRDLGLSVTRNKPYAGGYTTRHYASQQMGIHTLQIEINRALYMHEGTINRNAGFDRLVERIRLLVARLSSLDSGLMLPAQAAE